MTVEEDQQLGRPEYWDGRYATSSSDTPTHEWFRSFDDLEPYFRRNLFEQPGRTAADNPRILHLGSGDSVVPVEFSQRGYRQQLCVDFSPVVVDLMSERHKDIEGIEWRRVDVREMTSIDDKSIGVAFDKGTLDAMIYGSPWNPPDEVQENTSRYLKEVHRTLKDDGVFLYITFRQPHFMKILLNPDGLWDMEMETLSGEGTFDYYGYHHSTLRRPVHTDLLAKCTPAGRANVAFAPGYNLAPFPWLVPETSIDVAETGLFLLPIPTSLKLAVLSANDRRDEESRDAHPTHPTASATSDSLSRREVAADIHPETPNFAFQAALALLDEDQMKELTGGDGSGRDSAIRRLFSQLNEIDDTHRQQSLFRRGVDTVKPYLDGLHISLGFISPFAAGEPTAGTAIGLIQGVTSIAIAICGASGTLSDSIQSLLQRIPAIDVCSQSVGNGDGAIDAFQALVDVYKDLIDFHLKAIGVFKNSKFALHVTMAVLGSDLSGIISSFNNHSNLLFQLVDAETFSIVRGLRDETVESGIRELLDAGGNPQDSFQNELERRDDKACTWITSHDTVASWMSTSGDTKIMAMLGDMGKGKTMSTAYLVDHLSKQHTVCAYYCRGDDKTTRLGAIYRSLIWQLVQRRSQFKARFWKWVKEKESQLSANWTSPAESENHLHDFLFETLRSSQTWIFVVFDGLDECDLQTQKRVFAFLENLVEHEARLKVFLSFRHDEDTEACLPRQTVRIEVASSPERDRIIAAYHVNQTSIPGQLRDKAISALSKMAEGLAIWVRIAVEYLVKFRIKSEKGLHDALLQVPSSKDLTELYWRLFEKTCMDVPQNEDYLQQALEILATAYRPLTAEELACAIFSNPDEEHVKTVSQLEEAANSFDILDLARPFISITPVGGQGKSHIRLVHHSLTELILKAPPTEWALLGKSRRGRQSQPSLRVEQLHGELLQRCVKVLLFDDFSHKDFFQFSKDGNMDLLAIGGVFDDEDDEDEDTDGPDLENKNYDPVDLGLGVFYNYAASSWTIHLSKSAHDSRPSVSDFLALCGAGSNRLENWVQQWQRPSCAYVAEFTFPEQLNLLDPLVVAALFDPAVSLRALLKSDLASSSFLPDSVWTALKHLIRNQQPSVIKDILQNDAIGTALRSTPFLYEAAFHWRDSGTLSNHQSAAWQDLFSFMIGELRDGILEKGNDILCQASRCGCLPLVKALFRAADRDPELRAGIMTLSRQTRNNINHHQSVGEAAYEGHIDIVRFLCQQAGIQQHVQYVNNTGATVFHQAARRGVPEIFEILISAWPEGVNLRDQGNDTALQRLCFSHVCGDPETLRTAEVLLSAGKADATGSGDEVGQSPLFVAARNGDLALCRLLVVEGSADVFSVLSMEGTCRPALHR
ncbi:hypothetical protein ACJ41O_003355 [Fusarium nematophilum]